MTKKNGNNKQTSRTQQRPRTWNLILYRDSETYDFDDVLFNITDKSEKYYIIEHEAEDQTKKNHVHCVIRLKDGKTQSAVSKFFRCARELFRNYSRHMLSCALSYTCRPSVKKAILYR